MREKAIVTFIATTGLLVELAGALLWCTLRSTTSLLLKLHKLLKL
jgi:hypothetical protein